MSCGSGLLTPACVQDSFTIQAPPPAYKEVQAICGQVSDGILMQRSHGSASLRPVYEENGFRGSNDVSISHPRLAAGTVLKSLMTPIKR
jgi:hypothetical protein